MLLWAAKILAVQTTHKVGCGMAWSFNRLFLAPHLFSSMETSDFPFPFQLGVHQSWELPVLSQVRHQTATLSFWHWVVLAFC